MTIWTSQRSGIKEHGRSQRGNWSRAWRSAQGQSWFAGRRRHTERAGLALTAPPPNGNWSLFLVLIPRRSRFSGRDGRVPATEERIQFNSRIRLIRLADGSVFECKAGGFGTGAKLLEHPWNKAHVYPVRWPSKVRGTITRFMERAMGTDPISD